MRILETSPEDVKHAIQWVMIQPIKHTRIDGLTNGGILTLRWTSVPSGQQVTILRTSSESRYLETAALVLKLRQEFLTGRRDNVLIPHVQNTTEQSKILLKRGRRSGGPRKSPSIAMVG